MAGWTVSRLAKSCGLSRSALLHYESLGLLKPATRSQAGYRLYSESSVARLKRICAFREAGLPLREIARLLDSPEGKGLDGLFRRRMEEIGGEISRLRAQRQLIMSMLSRGKEGKASLCDKALLVEALRTSGMTEEGMRRFHETLESKDPRAHEDFLRLLGLSEDEIAGLRERLERKNG